MPQSVLRDLRTFADLRNLLSHQRYHGDRQIAEPTSEVLERIREIRESLLRPPTVLTVLAGRSVVSVQAADPVRSLLHLIRTLDYSQFPVYDGTAWVGLVTTNAIARWFARQMDDDEVTTGDEAVSAVLTCSEEQDTARHVPRTTTAADAIALLDQPLPCGSRPRALIVTTNGRPAESPLAVVVDEDLPRLLRALDASSATG